MRSTESSRNLAAFFGSFSRIRCFRWTTTLMGRPGLRLVSRRDPSAWRFRHGRPICSFLSQYRERRDPGLGRDRVAPVREEPLHELGALGAEHAFLDRQTMIQDFRVGQAKLAAYASETQIARSENQLSDARRD